jgi:hypothetical protein
MLTPLSRPHARRLLMLMAVALAISAARAHDEKEAPGCGKVGGPSRFAAFHDNYALWNQMSNNGWAPRDERALRGQLSLKYSFVGCPQRREKESGSLKPAPADAEATAEAAKAPGKPTSFWQRLRNAELFVSYTSRFDFYLGSRDSGPVINRLSNPGLHLRLPVGLHDNGAQRRDAWQISFEHMSDGQVVEPVTHDGDRLRAQRAYERGDRHFFDTISRGMNFVAIQGEWVWKVRGADAVFDVRAKVKHYVSSDSEITWGPLAGQALKFADYERLKVRAGLFLRHWGRFELTSQIGDRGFKHASHTLGWQSDTELPVYVQAHFGPMNTLSNYTQQQDSIGIGLRLAY